MKSTGTVQLELRVGQTWRSDAGHRRTIASIDGNRLNYTKPDAPIGVAGLVYGSVASFKAWLRKGSHFEGGPSA